MIDIAAIVLNWNGKNDTLECLTSLEQQEEVAVHVVVVDNGSTDDALEVIRREHPKATILETGSNLGYAGGNNVGLRHVMSLGHQYALVLNNDTVLDPRCISSMVSDMESNADAAAAAPKSVFFDAPNHIYFAGGSIDSHGEVAHMGWKTQDGPQFAHSADTQWLAGCAVLFRTSALRQIGLFEERFFLLFEDVDWSLRARTHGHRLRYVADARLVHKVSASFGATWTPKYLYYYVRNGCLFYERNFSMALKLGLIWLHIQRARRLVYGNWLRPEDLALRRRAMLCGLNDYALRRFGESRYSW